MRGFFEAEGSVFWHKRTSPKGGAIKSSISQNDYDILDFIYWELKELNIVNGGAMNHYKSHWKLYFSVNDSISLYHFMYDNCANNFLKRKKDRFEELIGRHV